MNPVNILEKFDLIKKYWDPKIVGELNGQHVKLARIKGEFTRHFHEKEDEMFLVIKGQLKMEFDDRIETINEGEFIIVPKGVHHKPNAEEEVLLLLFEPAGTLNTGNELNEFTKNNIERL